jgi:hypothetical protein
MFNFAHADPASPAPDHQRARHSPVNRIGPALTSGQGRGAPGRRPPARRRALAGRWYSAIGIDGTSAAGDVEMAR